MCYFKERALILALYCLDCIFESYCEKWEKKFNFGKQFVLVLAPCFVVGCFAQMLIAQLFTQLSRKCDTYTPRSQLFRLFAKLENFSSLEMITSMNEAHYEYHGQGRKSYPCKNTSRLKSLSRRSSLSPASS